MTWDEVLAKICQLQYHEPCEGEYDSTPPAIAHQAIDIARFFHSQGMNPPSAVISGVNGAVILKWRDKGWKFIVWEDGTTQAYQPPWMRQDGDGK